MRCSINILVEASIFREWILNVGRRDAKSRLAHVLCELAVRLDAHGLAEEMGYHLPMTQAELADALGLTPVHLNRVIRASKSTGCSSAASAISAFPIGSGCATWPTSTIAISTSCPAKVGRGFARRPSRGDG